MAKKSDKIKQSDTPAEITSDITLTNGSTINQPGLNKGFNPNKKPIEPLSKLYPHWHFNEEAIQFLRIIAKTNTILSFRHTNEKDISITYDALEARFISYTNGKEYAKALAKNKEKLVFNGLFTLNKKEGSRIVFIPDWDLFITALGIYVIMGNI